MSAKQDQFVTFRCSSKTVERLEEICREEDRPRSAVVRRFVERGLICYSDQSKDSTE